MFELIEIGPREVVTVKLVCDGCPKLHTKYWREHLDNDEADSGTAATCEAVDRCISVYWHVGDATPNWCPHLPPNTRN